MDETRQGVRYSFSDRLRWAIDQLPRDGRRRGLRHFVRLMEDRAREVADAGGQLAGTTLSAIQGYRDGEVEPSLTWTVEAAGVLGVRPAWLAYGDGAARESPAFEVDGAPPAGDPLLDSAAAARGLTPTTRTLLGEVWRRHVAASPEAFATDYDRLRFGSILLSLIDLPRDVWGLRHDLDAREANAYAVAILHAIGLVMPGPGEGDARDDMGTVYAVGIELVIDRERGAKLLKRRVRAAEERYERLTSTDQED